MIKKGTYLKHAINSFMVVLLVSNTCFASLKDVKSITITPSDFNKSGYLQVSEVVAIQTGTGKDLALASAGAIATSAPSYSKASNASNTISGMAPDTYPKIYHSKKNDGSPWLKITFAKAIELESISIYGRKGSHYNRDFYNLSLHDVKGNLIFTQSNLDAANSTNVITAQLTKTIPPKVAKKRNSKTNKTTL